jgi:hypothetical protein
MFQKGEIKVLSLFLVVLIIFVIFILEEILDEFFQLK